MTRLMALIACVMTLLVIAHSPAQAGGLPLIIGATVDYTHGTLTISGQNFGSNPAVTLNNLPLPTVSAASNQNQIVANFPSGQPPSSFTPGTYFLLVTYKNQLPTIFDVAIGANGPQGPQGPAGLQGPLGLQGPPGVQGLTGSTGAAGAMGPPGPMGPTGVAGAPGPAGVAGAAGPVGQTGAVGPQGPQGIQGAAGTNGANGAGVPVCAASDTVVSYQGALVCKSTLPRYLANGDGTVTDNQTGLMWEMLTSTCSGEVTCYTKLYTWSSTSTLADGTLYTAFLATLNGGDYYSPSAGQNVSATSSGACFANHCDWRIPTIAELKGILLAPHPCGTLPCIDPTFGPTPAGYYWSSSSLPGDASGSWFLSFDDGSAIGGDFKTSSLYARAVRSGR